MTDPSQQSNMFCSPLEAASAIEFSNSREPAGWATRQDWNKYRAIIKELYEEHELADVVDIMKNRHKFRATTNMYKKRIQEWGVAKTYRENEMQAVARKHKQRMDQGKQTSFRVRGRLVNYQDVIRYWKRKRLSISEVVAREIPAATPEAVICFTPIQSPVASPGMLANTECIFDIVRKYHYGSFENGTWMTANDRLLCYSIKDRDRNASHLLDKFRNHNIAALRLFACGSYQEGEQNLIAATADIKTILSSEHPSILEVLFTHLLFIQDQEKTEISSDILRQFSASSKIVLGKEHPLCRISEWLASVEPLLFNEVVLRCLQGICDHFDILLGPMHISTLRARMGYITAADLHQIDCQEKQLLQMKTLVGRCEKTLEVFDPRTVQVRCSLAFLFMSKRKHVQAREEGQKVLDHGRKLSELSDRVDFCAAGLYIIARSDRVLNETSSAVTQLRRAIGLRLSTYGNHDVRAGAWLVQLEEWLAEQGHVDFVVEVQ